MSLRVNARDGHYLAYLKCLWRPPKFGGKRKAYLKVLGAFSIWATQNGHLQWPWARTSSQRNLISTAPGSKLLSIVEFLFSPQTVECTFKPIIADWRMEYFDALKLEKRWKARWISVRYICRFIIAMGLSKVLSFIRGISASK